MKRRSWKRGYGAVRKLGSVWYIRFSQNGKRRDEKTRAHTKSEAEAILRSRLHELDTGTFDIDHAKVRISDLFADLQRDYTINGRHVEDLTKRWIHLSPVFGNDFCRTVTTPRIRQYIETRLKEEAAPATVQRETACLRRLLRLGHQSGKVTRLPYIPGIHVDNARKGFLERDDFDKVCAGLPGYLQPLAIMAFWSSWRKGELLKLEWRHVDLNTGEVRLEPSMTKTKQGRVIYLPIEALEALRSWRKETEKLEHANHCIIPSVFHHNGKPIKDFRKCWQTACTAAGFPQARFHDLRRSGVRNYVRSGVPEKVCMEISGHKTRSIFDRYNIVSPADLQKAAKQVSSMRNGEVMGKVTPLERKQADG